MNTDNILPILAAMTEKRRNECYVEINSWIWPREFLHLKPEGWENLRSPQRMEDAAWKTIWHWVKKVTSDFGQSEAWWANQFPDRTSAMHLDWYAGTFNP